MNSSLRTSASGMAAQQRMIDVIANNLANVNTNGFKRSRVSFEDVLYETLQGARIVNYQGTGTVGPELVSAGAGIGSSSSMPPNWNSVQPSASASTRPTASSAIRCVGIVNPRVAEASAHPAARGPTAP